jgi:hypothetical protein
VDDHLARLDLAAMTCTQRIRLPDANGAG